MHEILGNGDTPPILIKNATINIGRVFLLGDTSGGLCQGKSIPHLVSPHGDTDALLYPYNRMPSRYTKSKRSRNPTRPFVPVQLAEGVKQQRNGLIIDASICKAYANWQAAEDHDAADHPEEDREYAPHADGGTEGDNEPLREQEVQHHQ